MEDIATKLNTYNIVQKIQIERKDGDIFREWIKAQNDIKLGKQPDIIKKNGYILNNMEI